MTNEDDGLTPEALLKRAVGSITQAERDCQSGHEWALVAQTTIQAGQLALDIRNSEPRSVVLDGISEIWRSGIEAYTTKEPFKIREPEVTKEHTVFVWVSPEEYETILALRSGTATVQPRKPAQMPADAPEGVDPARGWGAREDELRDRLTNQEAKYHRILTGLMLARGVVSEFVPAADVHRTNSVRLLVRENPEDGSIILRITRP